MKRDKKIKSLKQDIKNYRLLSITYRGISILCILGTAYFIYKEFSPEKKSMLTIPLAGASFLSGIIANIVASGLNKSQKKKQHELDKLYNYKNK